MAVLILLLGACGMVDYTIHEENLFAPASKNKNVGALSFHYADGTESYEVRMRRVKGGYAVQAPLYEDADGSMMRFVASSTKEKSTFVGFESRFSF